MTGRHTAFPLSLVVTGKHLLLVGGGSLGTDRLHTARRFDWQRITMIAEDATSEIRAMAAEDERVTLYERAVCEDDVEATDLVIDSTTNIPLAETLASWCRPRRIPLNAMDKMECCDVHYPAFIERGPLLLAISSGGETPALAGTLRRLLEKQVGPGWCNAALLLAETRRSLPPGRERMNLLIDLARNKQWLEYIAENNRVELRRMVDEAVDRLGAATT